MELLQSFLILIGLLAARIAEADAPCPGMCAEPAARPVVAWAAPQNVRADEVRLFSRGERRPGQPAVDLAVVRMTGSTPRAVLVVAPAGERVGAELAVRVHRIPSAR
jgi:hypothetical protein